MKNTEYITIPKPELIEDYVNKSQIDLLTKIKTEIDNQETLRLEDGSDGYDDYINKDDTMAILINYIRNLDLEQKSKG